uniref:NADH dehydrogenase subunit 6 n=1 Tax=Mooreobdella quaternaria TaxID=3027019 RepID=UPI0023D7F3A0|nr:NADH dehydrogenase subunit 6 [Mooreobdella quaternaria]WDA96115.1 NADH dehydrogenase subunit 6 [Mooreobdella quaternaria]
MLISLFLFTLTSMMMIMNTPVLILFNILMMALSIAWMTGLMYSSWYSFLIFLIYIGGMMVMFSYFVAISPNQYMKIKSTVIMMMMTLLMISSPIMMKYNNNNKQYNNNNMFDTLYLYDPNMTPMLLFMMLLLLMMMLLVVKMINLSKGPLRPFMYV